MEDYEYIQNMPMVRRLRDDNRTMRKKNKQLKRKNKELSKLVKLVFANLELLQPLSKEINGVINSNIEVKQEPLCSPYEPEIIDNDVEIINPSANTLIKKCVECGENITILYGTHDSKYGLCYTCYSTRDCSTPKHIKKKAEEEEKVKEVEVTDDEEEVEEVEVTDEEVEVTDEEEEVEEVEVDEEEVEVEVEEIEVDEEEVEEVEVTDDEEVEEVEVDEEDEEEVEEVSIQGKMYYTTNKENGLIYDIDDNGDISIEVGKFNKGKPKFYKK